MERVDHVIAVPKTLPGLDDLDYLMARREWGSQVLMAFSIGTLSNVVIGFVGYVVGRHGYEFARALLLLNA